MTEKKLKDYFDNKITADELGIDLADSQKRTSYDVTTVYVERLEEDEFNVTIEHLIKLCDDALAGKLSSTDLNTISFALMASDYFTWDSDAAGERISNTIFEWNSPEIGFDISIKNLALWREYLLTGEYRLDKNELKEKFRRKGKYLKLYLAIDEILWTEWDPIGVNAFGLRDEYQSYTPAILRLKISGADAETIATKLYELETTTMGMPGNLDKCREVAKSILKL